MEIKKNLGNPTNARLKKSARSACIHQEFVSRVLLMSSPGMPDMAELYAKLSGTSQEGIELLEKLTALGVALGIGDTTTSAYMDVDVHKIIYGFHEDFKKGLNTLEFVKNMSENKPYTTNYIVSNFPGVAYNEGSCTIMIARPVLNKTWKDLLMALDVNWTYTPTTFNMSRVPSSASAASTSLDLTKTGGKKKQKCSSHASSSSSDDDDVFIMDQDRFERFLIKTRKDTLMHIAENVGVATWGTKDQVMARIVAKEKEDDE